MFSKLSSFQQNNMLYKNVLIQNHFEKESSVCLNNHILAFLWLNIDIALDVYKIYRYIKFRYISTSHS